MSFKPGKRITTVVQELSYTTPPLPELNQIRNFDLPKHKQMWSRRVEYDQWYWGEGWDLDASDEQLIWLEEEITRLHDGEWIYINGVPTYFNRYCYFFHQWFVLETGDYPDYRDTTLEFTQFYEMCFKHPLCLGMVLIKGRRLGATSISTSIQLLNAIFEKNTVQGMISKTREDAKAAFKMVTGAFGKLLSFLKPKNSGNDAGVSELYIREQPKRIKLGQKASSGNEGLNNYINYLAPSENSYDGRRLFTLLIDEAGKMPVEMSIYKYWRIAKRCLMTGSRVIGKAIMITTVNRAEKGGAEFRKIWDESAVEDRNDLGATKSGLWRFFIPGWKGYDGYVDQFGNSVWDTPTAEQTNYLASIGCPNPLIGSKKYTDDIKAQFLNDLESYMEELRLCPSTWQEVFKSAVSQSYFNAVETGEQLEIVKGILLQQGLDPEKDELGRRGWFVRSNGRIRFIDDKAGMWYVNKLLPDEESNKFERIAGKKVPTNTALGAAGLDPIATTRLTVDQGSDACVVIRERYSSANPENTGGHMAFFLGRPPKKRFFHEQVFNGLEYYGVKMLGELAPDDWVEYAEEPEVNMTGYLIGTKDSAGREKYGISPQDKQAREEHLTLMVESSHSDTKKITSRRCLQDRLHFDPDNRTVFDFAIADGYALMALKEPYMKRERKKRTKSMLPTGSITVS